MDFWTAVLLTLLLLISESFARARWSKYFEDFFLQHRQQQMKQYRRGEQRERKARIANGRETQQEGAQIS